MSHHTVGDAVARIVTLSAAWVGSVTITDIEPWVRVASGIAIMVYSIHQTMALRAESRRKRLADQQNERGPQAAD
ncbi:MAG: hypothetical protein RL030_1729 [Pseudomonadota bacterium]|jgi:cytochrome c biogenesis protein CcdA